MLQASVLTYCYKTQCNRLFHLCHTRKFEIQTFNFLHRQLTSECEQIGTVHLLHTSIGTNKHWHSKEKSLPQFFSKKKSLRV